MEDYRRVNSEAFMYFIEPPARAHCVNNHTRYNLKTIITSKIATYSDLNLDGCPFVIRQIFWLRCGEVPYAYSFQFDAKCLTPEGHYC